VKAKKPTGNGKHLTQITRTKTNDPSDASDHESPSRADKVHTTVARNGRSNIPEPCCTCAHQTAELVGKIASALDPETQHARDNE